MIITMGKKILNWVTGIKSAGTERRLTILNKSIRAGFIEKVLFEQRP